MQLMSFDEVNVWIYWQLKKNEIHDWLLKKKNDIHDW
jgi:hypothetical protein